MTELMEWSAAKEDSLKGAYCWAWKMLIRKMGHSLKVN